MADQSPSEDLLRRFQAREVLNQDQLPPRTTLLGHIAPSEQPALLILEPTSLPLSPPELPLSLPQRLSNITTLGTNDIYAWFTATLASRSSPQASEDVVIPTLRATVISPASDKMLRKYAPQKLRVVTETGELWQTKVRPWVQAKRGLDGAGVRWVWNILDGISERESVLWREEDSEEIQASVKTAVAATTDASSDRNALLSSSSSPDPRRGWILLPDMNWDRCDRLQLRLLLLVQRRDILSLRDLCKRDIAWLRALDARVRQVVQKEFGVEPDQLRIYMHYHPTYYHFHIHITHVSLAPGPTIALGRAVSLSNVVAQLESMAGGPETGMADTSLEYTVGEESELWHEVWKPWKDNNSHAQAQAASS